MAHQSNNQFPLIMRDVEIAFLSNHKTYTSNCFFFPFLNNCIRFISRKNISNNLFTVFNAGMSRPPCSWPDARIFLIKGIPDQ